MSPPGKTGGALPPQRFPRGNGPLTRRILAGRCICDARGTSQDRHARCGRRGSPSASGAGQAGQEVPPGWVPGGGGGRGARPGGVRPPRGGDPVGGPVSRARPRSDRCQVRVRPSHGSTAGPHAAQRSGRAGSPASEMTLTSGGAVSVSEELSRAVCTANGGLPRSTRRM